MTHTHVYVSATRHIYMLLWHDSFVCECDMTHSVPNNPLPYVRRYSFICETELLVCQCTWTSRVCVTCLIYMCMSVWHDLFICETWLFVMSVHMGLWLFVFICDMTHSCVTLLIQMWQDSFICGMTHLYVMRHIHICVMTHCYFDESWVDGPFTISPRTPHDSFICEPWLVGLSVHVAYVYIYTHAVHLENTMCPCEKAHVHCICIYIYINMQRTWAFCIWAHGAMHMGTCCNGPCALHMYKYIHMYYIYICSAHGPSTICTRTPRDSFMHIIQHILMWYTIFPYFYINALM